MSWWIGAWLATLLVHLGLLAMLPGDGRWVEAIYARHIYPAIGPIVAFVPSLLPFSLAAVLLVVAVVWVPGYLALNVVRWRRRRIDGGTAFLRTLLAYSIVGALGFHAFYLFWGYNYLRPPLEQRLGLTGADLSAERREAFSLEFVAETSASRVPVTSWDLDALDALVDGAMKSAVLELEGRAPPVVSPLKGDLDTGFLAWQGYRGVIAPFTLEAHVDFGLPPSILPFAAAHEKAHLAGFARERDANFVAWLALTRSDDPRLRYAGRFGVLGYFLDAESRKQLSAGVEADLLAVSRYSRAHVSPTVQRASRQVYSAYLKANRMPTGIADYSQVWQLILAWNELRS
jgi:hypothetical protein